MFMFCLGPSHVFMDLPSSSWGSIYAVLTQIHTQTSMSTGPTNKGFNIHWRETLRRFKKKKKAKLELSIHQGPWGTLWMKQSKAITDVASQCLMHTKLQRHPSFEAHSSGLGLEEGCEVGPLSYLGTKQVQAFPPCLSFLNKTKHQLFTWHLH